VLPAECAISMARGALDHRADIPERLSQNAGGAAAKRVAEVAKASEVSLRLSAGDEGYGYVGGRGDESGNL
jgi:hypothetical protein